MEIKKSYTADCKSYGGKNDYNFSEKREVKDHEKCHIKLNDSSAEKGTRICGFGEWQLQNSMLQKKLSRKKKWRKMYG